MFVFLLLVNCSLLWLIAVLVRKENYLHMIYMNIETYAYMHKLYDISYRHMKYTSLNIFTYYKYYLDKLKCNHFNLFCMNYFIKNLLGYNKAIAARACRFPQKTIHDRSFIGSFNTLSY